MPARNSDFAAFAFFKLCFQSRANDGVAREETQRDPDDGNEGCNGITKSFDIRGCGQCVGKRCAYDGDDRESVDFSIGPQPRDPINKTGLAICPRIAFR